ncbi:DUF3953 domain-containing protein [Psychrobacillus psychrodurans]|uniref:DUF3953 domain-containing protein n=1 Tax=Psychrobacillus psychrodurans TaxID=126157 RepID=UPI003D042D65
MKVSRVLLGIIVIVFSSYILISKNYELMPFMMLLLGTLMLVSGIVELQKDRKKFEGYLFIIVSLFIFLVFIQCIF